MTRGVARPEWTGLAVGGASVSQGAEGEGEVCAAGEQRRVVQEPPARSTDATPLLKHGGARSLTPERCPTCSNITRLKIPIGLQQTQSSFLV